MKTWELPLDCTGSRGRARIRSPDSDSRTHTQMQKEERAFQPGRTGWRAPHRAGETRDQGFPVREKSAYRAQ